MIEYRAYVIGSDDHIVGAEALICGDDVQAIAEIAARLHDRTIEIWSGDRFVIRLYPEGQEHLGRAPVETAHSTIAEFSRRK